MVRVLSVELHAPVRTIGQPERGGRDASLSNRMILILSSPPLVLGYARNDSDLLPPMGIFQHCCLPE